MRTKKTLRGALLSGLAMAISGCAVSAGTADGNDQVEASPAQAQQAFSLSDLGRCGPACMKELACDLSVSDDCCDPAQYDSCTRQVDGPDPDVQIKIYQCKMRGPGYSLGGPCEVEPGWTVIGGGAEILDADPDEVTLTSSFPNADGALFPETDMRGARSWDFDTAQIGSHAKLFRLKPYVIGIKLKGYDNVHHFAPVKVTYSGWTTKDLDRPRMSVKVRSNFILLGGGYQVASTLGSRGMAIVNASASGMMGGTWTVSASRGPREAVGDVSGAAISIDSCPDLWSSCFSGRTATGDSGPTGTGVQSAFAQSPGGGYLLTGMGAWSSNDDRPLGTIAPITPAPKANGGVWVTTGGDSSGFAHAQALHLHR